jgi:hypothetical protein
LKILLTGSGSSGSWIIRGQQLGAAIGATVEPRCADPRGFDLAVLVKRPPMDLVLRLQRYGIPLAWDIVDAWPQPLGNDWTERACKAWLAERVAAIKPAAIVAATQAMADDCAGFGVPVLALPHHARPGLGVNPIRERVSRVGYDGGEQYLGKWLAVIERACQAHGWTFHMKPSSLSDMDIVVAVRDQKGYAPRFYKSNVKLANCQGSGTPVICNREAGYLETDNGGAVWADCRVEFEAALDDLVPRDERIRRSALLLANQITIEKVAAKYIQWLETLRC